MFPLTLQARSARKLDQNKMRSRSRSGLTCMLVAQREYSIQSFKLNPSITGAAQREETSVAKINRPPSQLVIIISSRIFAWMLYSFSIRIQKPELFGAQQFFPSTQACMWAVPYLPARESIVLLSPCVRTHVGAAFNSSRDRPL